MRLRRRIRVAVAGKVLVEMEVEAVAGEVEVEVEMEVRVEALRRLVRRCPHHSLETGGYRTRDVKIPRLIPKYTNN